MTQVRDGPRLQCGPGRLDSDRSALSRLPASPQQACRAGREAPTGAARSWHAAYRPRRLPRHRRGDSPRPSGPGRPPGGFAPGFTLIELLVVITIIMILSGMLTAAIFKVRESVLRRTGKVDIRTFTMALSQYKRELGAYPPDDYIDPATGWTVENGLNEVLVYYLGGRHKKGANYYGPYMIFKEGRLEDRDGDGIKEYLDPFGNLYEYAENASQTAASGASVGKNPRSYDLVSKGPDQDYGGTMSAAAGFEPINDAAGLAAQADNVSNWSK